MHVLHIEAVALLLQIIDTDDIVLDHFGMFKIFQFLHDIPECLNTLREQIQRRKYIRADLRHVAHINLKQHFLHRVRNIIDIAAE